MVPPKKFMTLPPGTKLNLSPGENNIFFLFFFFAFVFMNHITTSSLVIKKFIGRKPRLMAHCRKEIGMGNWQRTNQTLLKKDKGKFIFKMNFTSQYILTLHIIWSNFLQPNTWCLIKGKNLVLN